MDNAEVGSDTALEVVTLLPGLTTLHKRSGELDGNLPVRAARYCGPVFDGNQAGFQITVAQPMTLHRNRQGGIDCTMTDPTLQLVRDEVDAALERGVNAGLIAADGYWRRAFRGNALPTRRGRLLFWTGHVVRPRRGAWALVGGAFNRRSRVSVIDHVVTDPDSFVPLVLEIDGRELTREPAWLEAEVGCITPLLPRVRLRKARVEPGAPELRQFASFFSGQYFETKAQHPTAAYVKRQRDNRVKAAPACDAALAYVGPDVHVVGEFDRFIAPNGFSRTQASEGSLHFARVANIAPTRWQWDGQTHRVFEVDTTRVLPAIASLWRETFGDGEQSALEFLRAHLIGGAWDQPYFQYQPWAFTRTPEGWSTLIDGCHRPPGYDGMRGVIATDWFFALAMVYRVYGPAKGRIPYRAPMFRIIPVPRATLALGIDLSTV